MNAAREAAPARVLGEQASCPPQMTHASAADPVPHRVLGGRPEGRTRAFELANAGCAFFLLVVVKMSAASTIGSPCITHDACGGGLFCKVSMCDSYEGWTYDCAECRPCAECECSYQSSTGDCPADRCIGSPYSKVHTMQGTFVSASAIGSWGGDVCLVTLTIHESTFRMMTSRVAKDTYDVSQAASRQNFHVGPSLCHFPDGPGLTEGMLEALPVEEERDLNPEIIGKLKMTYFSGIPLGVSRAITVFDNCPMGVSATFEPIAWVPVPYNTGLGLAPDRYTYKSGIEGRPYDILPTSGYVLTDTTINGLTAATVQVELDGPSMGYSNIFGVFSGYFAYGTTRSSQHDLGAFPSLICNTTFLFELGHKGVAYWDQYTWGCRVRYPVPEQGGSRQRQSQPKDLSFPFNLVQKQELETKTEQITGVTKRTHERTEVQTPSDQSSMTSKVQVRNKQQVKMQRNETGLRDTQDGCPKGFLMSDKGNILLTYEPVIIPQDCDSCPDDFVCVPCPRGWYNDRHDESMECLSCPYGFTNKMSGSTTLGDCCEQQRVFGLYNDRGQTSYNVVEFGQGRLSGKYYTCPSGQSYPSAACSESIQSISTIPEVINMTVDKSEASEGFCSEVRFTIQPTIGQDAVSALLALDFGCAGCTFDLRPNDQVYISLYRASSTEAVPTELVKTCTPKPSANFRDFKFSSLHQVSSNEKGNVSLFHFNSTYSPATDNSLRGPAYVNPQVVISRLMPIPVKLLYHCDYEDPGGVYERGLQDVPRSPVCADKLAQQVEMMNNLQMNTFTPFDNSTSLSQPTVVGVRVVANLHPSSSFKFGYKFSQTHGKCRPGFFMPINDFLSAPVDENSQCQRCSVGKFTPSDQSTYCFSCPLGTYADTEGASRCLQCPTGKFTIETGSYTVTQCKAFCRAGSFSSTGMEPCQLCPRGKWQDKVGAVVCQSCPDGWDTIGAGSTNVDPWLCFDARDVSFKIESIRARGTGLSIVVNWKLPILEVSIYDVIAIMKGDPLSSKRQLQWAYASTALGIDTPKDGEIVCTVVAGVSCKQPGASVKPWASITFDLDGAGPGTYSAVYYSKVRGIRTFFASTECVSELCPYQTDIWMTDTGLYVCKPGQSSGPGSMFDGSGPCAPCPIGTFSDSYGMANCTACPQGYFSGFRNGDLGTDIDKPIKYTHVMTTFEDRGYSNDHMVGATGCAKCPIGSSTMKPGSVYEDCVSCDTLLEQKPDAVFEGCDTGITKIQTTGVIETTVVTTTPPPLEDDQCGNGKVMDGSSEECDDGNTQDGDGCTQECKIEPGWKCTSTNSSDTVMPCVKACGDGKVDKPSEECDDGNALDGDGCGRDCIITIGWACAEDIHGISRCRELPECANWKREWEKGEECDDGNFINGDGCSQFCTIEAGYACTNFSYKEDVCCATLDLCGNGKKDLCEKCDDGNRKSNDGCSSECVVEQMYQCRDGCNGPLCISESDCDEHLIGRRVQTRNVDYLGWLGIDEKVTEIGYDVKTLKFSIEDSDSITSSSSGHFLDLRRGPFNAGVSHLFTTMNKKATVNGFERFLLNEYATTGFLTSYGLDKDSQIQLACKFCSGEKVMNFPFGNISEPKGMLANDRDCKFIFSGGNGIRDVELLTKLIIVTVHHVSFESDDEFLIISDGVWNATIKNDNLLPAEFPLPVNSFVRFIGLAKVYAGVTWSATQPGVRFKISYKTVILNAKGRSCSLSCQVKGVYDYDCMKREGCAAMSKDVNIGDSLFITNLQEDFGNANAGRRRMPHGESGKVDVHGVRAHHIGQGNENTMIRFSSTGRRNDNVNHLTLLVSGREGTNVEKPCIFAQNVENLLISAQKREDQWSGLNGLWSGTCSILSSCSDTFADNEACVFGDDYDDASNKCSVSISVVDSVLRIYIYDCSIAGVAHALIVDVGKLRDVPSPSGKSLVRFRTMSLLWTKSTFPDRPVGQRTKSYMTFGASGSYDPKISSGAQIMLGTTTEYPNLDIDANFGRFSSRYGACRRMDLAPSTTNDGINLRPFDSEYLMRSGKAAILNDLRLYQNCNNSFQEIQQLSKRSDCKHVLDTFLFRDVKSDFRLQKTACQSSCLAETQKMLLRVVEQCHKSFRSEFLSEELYRERVYKKLYLAATASALAQSACLKNHRGEHCTKSIHDYAELFTECPLFSRSTEAFASSFLKSTSNSTCPGKCFAALSRYQVQHGCCAGTVGQVANEWYKRLEVQTSENTRPLMLDLGITMDPWTNLGAAPKEYELYHKCDQTREKVWTGSAMVLPDCFVSSPKMCARSSAWCGKCCDISCENGGSKAYDGACYCSCPRNRTGYRCQGQSEHASIDLVFVGESIDSWTCEKTDYLKQALADISVMTTADVEVDTIQPSNAARRGASINVLLRIVTSGGFRDCLRIASEAKQSVENGDLKRMISRQSGDRFSPGLRFGKYTPIAFDKEGRELCDNREVICQLVVQQPNSTSSTVTSAGGVSRDVMVIVLAVLVAIFSVIGVGVCYLVLRKHRTQVNKFLSPKAQALKEMFHPQKAYRPIHWRKRVFQITFDDQADTEKTKDAQLRDLVTKQVSITGVKGQGEGDGGQQKGEGKEKKSQEKGRQKFSSQSKGGQSVQEGISEPKLSASIQYSDPTVSPSGNLPTEEGTRHVMDKLFVVPERLDLAPLRSTIDSPRAERDWDRRQLIHYDADQVEGGLREVDAQRSQIMNRLKYLKKMQAKTIPTSIKEPAMLAESSKDLEMDWALPPVHHTANHRNTYVVNLAPAKHSLTETSDSKAHRIKTSALPSSHSTGQSVLKAASPFQGSLLERIRSTDDMLGAATTPRRILSSLREVQRDQISSITPSNAQAGRLNSQRPGVNI